MIPLAKKLNGKSYSAIKFNVLSNPREHLKEREYATKEDGVRGSLVDMVVADEDDMEMVEQVTPSSREEVDHYLIDLFNEWQRLAIVEISHKEVMEKFKEGRDKLTVSSVKHRVMEWNKTRTEMVGLEKLK